MAVFIYFKLLMVLQIFKPFRMMIVLIIKCLYDMLPFMFLVFLSLLIFTSLNYIEPYKKMFFVEHLLDQYMILYGNLPNPKQNEQWVLFIFFSIFMNILMLNLLISILGNTFDQVQSTQKSSDLRQVCELLLDFGELKAFVMGLFCCCNRQHHHGTLKETPEYLHMIEYQTEIGSKVQGVSGTDDEDQWAGRVKFLQTSITNVKATIKEEMKRSKDDILKAVSSELAKMKEEVRKNKEDAMSDAWVVVKAAVKDEMKEVNQKIDLIVG